MNETCGLLLCDDLIFTSRIVGTAKALGLSLRTAKTVAELRQTWQEMPPRCVIVDLQLAGADIDELAREAIALTPRPFLIGYGSHVDTATLTKARAAGLDVVWPRSKFVEELATALPGWFRGSDA
jgi:CheY-like chemotaxis protein